MKFIIKKEVFEKYPDLIIAIPIIQGFDNKKSQKESLKFLREQEQYLKRKLTLEDLYQDKRITLYTDAFKKFGASPEKNLPTHLAMAKRVLEGGHVPDINPLVNIYNGLSLRYLTPFGGEDLGTLYGNFVLQFAEGNEQWIAIGAQKSKSPKKGELIWGDDYDVSTRALNWRQGERTKLIDSSEDGYFIMDGFASNKDIIQKAADEFINTATKLTGGEGHILWLDKTNPEAEVDFQTKKLAKNKKATLDKHYSFVPAKEKAQKAKQEKTHTYIGPAKIIASAISKATGVKAGSIHLESPAHPAHGDYSSNIALQTKSDPEEIKAKLESDASLKKLIEKIEIKNNFLNFFLAEKVLSANLKEVLTQKAKFGQSTHLKGKKIMMEFAHPNTHKELHIGHMRTLILGESLSRISEAAGASVFRANYQGDIGPHVAKSIWGTQKILKNKNQSFDDTEKLSLAEKAHLLGEGYIQGNELYEENKKEIDAVNVQIYQKDPAIYPIYERTRTWSLEYYDSFYKRFYTKFDKLYFESKMSEPGKQVVLDNTGKIFEKSKGAIVFPGEKYDLHTRVFITQAGTPTYEAKDMALAPVQYKDFKFDQIVHVLANEQVGYFSVVKKALELLYPEHGSKQYHLPMGMVNLVGKKMSSRTGVIIRVDVLLGDIAKAISKIAKTEKPILEKITIAAVKYSVLKVNPEQSVLFDLEKSIDTNGNSGPYLQYTYARTQSVLEKASTRSPHSVRDDTHLSLRGAAATKQSINQEESLLLRHLTKFPEVIIMAAENYAPNLLCNYLYDLAQKYNSFYSAHKIVGSSTEDFRLALTAATGQVLTNGLTLLGISSPEKM